MNNMNVFNPAVVAYAKKTERVILSALLVERDAIGIVQGIVDVEYFCEPIHREIYRQIRKLYDANDAIDLLTVGNVLLGNELYNQNGGIAYLLGLSNEVASAVDIERHCYILREIYALRQFLLLGRELQHKAGNGEDVANLLAFLNDGTGKINDLTICDDTSHHVSVAVKEALQEAYNRQDTKKQGKTTSVSTGLTGLDHLVGGWKKAELIVLAARPSMGKTALMLYFAKVAAKAGHHVCLYSLEMSRVSLADRLMLSACEVDSTGFRDGYLTDEENIQVGQAAGQIERLPIYINDKADVSMSYIRQDAKRRAGKGECDIIMVDYLQLLDMNNGKTNTTRDREVAEASRQAKIIAKELNVPFVLLSQLNREVEKRGGKEPILADLRDSGAIEQDADVVCFVHRPACYGLREVSVGNRQYTTQGLGFLYVKKQRNGRLGCVVFKHNNSMTQMSDFMDYGDKNV